MNISNEERYLALYGVPYDPGIPGKRPRPDVERETYETADREWSKAVRARDGYRCVQCGASEDLHAHHVKPKSTHPELRHDITNGITLCTACHAAEHPESALLQYLAQL